MIKVKFIWSKSKYWINKMGGIYITTMKIISTKQEKGYHRLDKKSMIAPLISLLITI